MKNVHISTEPVLSRRTFLTGVGVTLALPLLDAMLPSFSWARPPVAADKPRRMLSIITNMGIMPQFYFPKDAGRDYELSPYLENLKDFRQDMTVFSGVSHPDVDGGHHSDITWLTAAPHPGRGGFRNTISLDQFAAERIGNLTRFPSLPLLVGIEGKRSLSWTSSGVMISGEKKPSLVFQRLFVQGNARQVAVQVDRLREGRSILDAVAGRAKALESKVGVSDREKLDQYFTSVRELEQRLHKAEEWEQKPKASVAAKPPEDIDDPADLLGKSRLMYDMARLALQTDSTRIITVFIEEDHNPKVKLDGITQGHHSLTHHGNRPDVVGELRHIEEAQFGVLRELLAALKSTPEQGETLLDRTMVLYGTHLGNANAHSNNNLPVLIAGGGFKHGQHLAFKEKQDYPLPNLFVSMLQRLGLEVDRFASSTGTIRGLEMT